MIPFFSSVHCRSQLHCTICRDFQRGRFWRSQVREVFADIGSVDWACPNGREWVGLSSGESGSGSRAFLGFDQVVNAILLAPEVGLWSLLKDELRILTDVLVYQGHRPACWKRRQRMRLISQYNVVVAKMKSACNVPAVPFEQPAGSG